MLEALEMMYMGNLQPWRLHYPKTDMVPLLVLHIYIEDIQVSHMDLIKMLHCKWLLQNYILMGCQIKICSAFVLLCSVSKYVNTQLYQCDCGASKCNQM